MMPASELGLKVAGLGRPEMTECPQCGAAVRRTLLPFRMKGQLFGCFPADVCGKGHEWFPEESGAAIEAIAKARKLWGIDSRRKARRSRRTTRRPSRRKRPVA